MKIFKIMSSVGIFSVVGICMNVFAATNTIHGSACQWSEPEHNSIIAGYDNPNGYKNVRYSRYGIENRNYPVGNGFLRTNSAEEAFVVCPVTIEESVGTNANIRAYIQDLQGNNKCRATIRNSNGGHVWKGGWKSTGTTASSVSLYLGGPSVSSNGINLQVVVECLLHPTTFKGENPATVRAVKVY